jgi:hypothetical protein
MIRDNLKSGVALHCIFSALVGPRIMLAPEGADGGGSEGAPPAGGDGAAPPATPPAAPPATEEKKTEEEPSALAGAFKEVEKKEGEAEGEKKEGEPEKKEVEQKQEPDKSLDIDGNKIPEKYEIKMPDGVVMNEELLAEATPLLREARLSPAQAQVVADLYMKTQSDAIDRFAQQQKDWAKQSREDKEIGGKNYEQNIALAHKGFKAVGSPEALQVFEAYGLGNHPEVLRIFMRIGSAVGEGNTILSGDGGGRVSDAKALYPDMGNQK